MTIQRLSGKRCLITAAGAGIGRATALSFAREGALVLATDIDAGALQSLADEQPSIRTAVLDATDPAQIALLIDSNPHIDVLFNCAGYVHAGSILNTTLSDWRRSFAINIDSMFHLCKAVLPGMLERGRGRIINMRQCSAVTRSHRGTASLIASQWVASARRARSHN